MKTNKSFKILLLILGVLAIFAIVYMLCKKYSGDDVTSDTTSGDKSVVDSPVVNKDKYLNISIFLDLSDRLVQPMEPSQMARDTAIVNGIVDFFIEKSFNAKLLKSENHLRLFFYPTPQNGQINMLSKALDVDLKKLKGAEKKQKLESMKASINTSLEQIYTSTLKSKNWIGCDIWGFFSSNKVDMCLRKDCRNIMIILTDGYVYAENNLQKKDNAYSYISSQTLDIPDSKLITKRKGLDNLEILLMEINPKDKVKHETRMTEVLEGWFKSMGVKKVSVVTTDISANTLPLMESFLNDDNS